MKKALITGVTGQDGAYLSELLLSKGYEVHGLKRRSSSFNTARIDHLYQDPHLPDTKFKLHYGDLTDAAGVIKLIKEIEPDEIYNLGAMSHVHVSFDIPVYTAQVDAMGALHVLEAVRLLGMEKKTKIYQASTSEMFGAVTNSLQDEETRFKPQSPYACAKVFAYWSTINYREAYGMFACNGILFNHESPLRGETFVSRKITMGVSRIAAGLQKCLYMGNLSAMRDWGHAKDYVEAMWLMLQQPKPDDFVIATGESCSVEKFLIRAFEEAGIVINFDTSQNIAVVTSTPYNLNVKVGDVVVMIDPKYFRPTEVEYLKGDATKARKVLGWQPNFNFETLVADMMEHDMRLASEEKDKINGYKYGD